MNDFIKIAEQVCTPSLPKLPDFNVGDTINVHLRIRDKEKERIQQFQGTVIQIKRCKAHVQSVTVRKLSDGIAVERILPMPHPMIAKVEVKQRGKVRRSRLFYLRERTGKAAKVKQKRR